MTQPLTNAIDDAISAAASVPVSNFTDLPPGDYFLAITKSEWKMSKNGFPAYVLHFEVVYPDNFGGETLQKWMTFPTQTSNNDSKMLWHRAQDFQVLGYDCQGEDGTFNFAPMRDADPTGLVVKTNVQKGSNGYPEIRFDRKTEAIPLRKFRKMLENSKKTAA